MAAGSAAAGAGGAAPRPVGPGGGQPGTVTVRIPDPARDAAAATVVDGGQTQWQLFRDAFKQHQAAWISLWVVTGLTFSCVFVPFILPWSPTEIDYKLVSATAPSFSHPLGTDTLGRDVLARVLAAGRISLLIGLMVALISATIGAVVGVTAGYFGGKIDEALMWLVNVLMAVPSLPLLIALAAVAAAEEGPAATVLRTVPPEWRIIIIMSLLGWMPISRLVRSKVISLRKQEFVEAAIALGGADSRVMGVHILPNTINVLAVFTTLAVSNAILGESALSFLGVGVSPPTATWGNMLYDARDVFTALNYWWMTWAPAILILVTVLCVNFIGDGMRDAFDPHARKR